MLKLAYLYQSKLNESWQSIVFNNKYKYYNYSNYWKYQIDVDRDSWNEIQCVSVGNDDKVIGYLAAVCNRGANSISSLKIINFENMNVTFSKDLYEFLDSLFTLHNFNKLEWCVVIGNPAEKMYDKIVNKYGGKIVGIQHESTKLEDGKLYDVKEYELFKRDYLKIKIN